LEYRLTTGAWLKSEQERGTTGPCLVSVRAAPSPFLFTDIEPTGSVGNGVAAGHNRIWIAVESP
jgi:hypothetical protein